MIIYKNFYLLFLLLLSQNLMSQNEISGTIKDAQTAKAVANASVYLPDLKRGAISDNNGHYDIKNLPKGEFLLQTSIIGYATQIKTISINGPSTISFDLIQSSTGLETVIVTGAPWAIEQTKNPVPVSVLAKTDLRRNTYTNIIDALNVIPGVSEITLGPSISKPIIRGLGYNRVITMNDGVRQEGQQWFDE